MSKKKGIRLKNKLSDYLVLPEFFAHKLNYPNFISLLRDLKDVKEGYNSNGISYFCEVISSKGMDISKYDIKIKNYVDKISKNRGVGFTLKYYQYIAVLFTQMYLEDYFNDNSINKYKFMEEINSFIDKKNESSIKKLGIKDLKPFKLAYYMATGSGKTIVMHINYLQLVDFINEYGFKIDNCILITPSEYMTEQHINEFRRSGIDAIEFNGLTTLESFNTNNFIVKVIDINKLRESESKKGVGVTIDISAFGSQNLLLVDEGHKGYKSEEQEWVRRREKLSKNGFTLEYSATFEQAISDDLELMETYGHSIIMDYSYKYFYGDGYGKDFYILNLEKETPDDTDTRHTLLLGNALSFLNQLMIYNNNKEIINKYNIERPLWIFVGSKVNTSNDKTKSDIINVVKFIHWITSQENKFEIIDKINKILNGKSGITDRNNNDVFSKQYDELLFSYELRNMKAEEIYSEMLKLIFKCNGGSKLEFYRITKTDGEIGIKCNNEYFAVIDVGDRDQLISTIESDLKVNVIDDILSESLFESINEKPNKINLLIGAKKFIEGWDTKRVSSMCLLNVGKKEGSQIIQLFGRGVRLNGINYSMKREFNPDPELRALQTLYIYGIKASYLITFKEIIHETNLFVSKKIKINKKSITPPLDVVILDDQKIENLKKDFNFPIEYNTEIKPRLVKLAKADSISSQSIALIEKNILNKPNLIPDFLFSKINWDEIFFKILEFKFNSKMYNIIISPEKFEELKQKLFYDKSPGYELIIDQSLLNENNIDIINDIIYEIFKNYLESFYNKKIREKLSSINNNIYKLDKFTMDKIPDHYLLYGVQDLINKIPNIISKNNYSQLNLNNININFIYEDLLLYEPLIYYNENNSYYTIPTGLNEGERTFVEDLIGLIKNNTKINEINISDYEIYLFRNPSKIGHHFYINNEVIYPDFILWVREKVSKNQVIAYIEPHGLIFADLENDAKLNLPDYFKSIGNKINGIKLCAFIVSVTDYDNLYSNTKRNYSKKDLKNKGIVFQKDNNYLNEIFEKIFNLIKE